MSQYVPTRYKVLCIIDERCRVKSYIREVRRSIYTHRSGVRSMLCHSNTKSVQCIRVAITTRQVSAVTYYTLANLNILLCPLVYIIAQAPSKVILIILYRTTLITSALRTQTTYLFIIITLLSTLSTFKRFQNTLGIQDFILI